MLSLLPTPKQSECGSLEFGGHHIKQTATHADPAYGVPGKSNCPLRVRPATLQSRASESKDSCEGADQYIHLKSPGAEAKQARQRQDDKAEEVVHKEHVEVVEGTATLVKLNWY